VPVSERPQREHAPADAPELATLRAALAAIPNDEVDSLDYDAWRNIIFAIHHATDGADEGLKLAHEFSARSPKYDADFLDNRVWPYIRSERDSLVTARTLFSKAREYGYEEPVADDFEILDDTGGLKALEGQEVIVVADGSKPESAKRERFKVFDEDDLLAIPRPAWWVKNVIPKAELVVIYGASTSGKSFLAIDLFAAVGRGIPWRGFKTQRGRVVYVAAEGQGGFRNRLEAYRRHHDARSGLKVVVDAPDLLKADAGPLAKQILASGGADIIVIDTLAQVSPGGDENSAEDMGKVMSNCRKMHRATGALIVLIHHAGKDLSKGARGWSGLKAAADAEIEVNRIDSERWVKVTKLKDGEDGGEFRFKLMPVLLGEDEDGDDITSCVIEHLEAEKRTASREPGGANNRLVWRVAHELAELGDGQVPVSSVIDEAARRLPHVEGKEDRRRYLARRAIEALVDKGFATVLDDIVHLPNSQKNAD